MKNPTSYKDINAITALFSRRLQQIFDEQLVGFYLTGSLTYGGFNRATSDLDFVVILKQPLSDDRRRQIKLMHAAAEGRYPEWARRIEVPYILQELLGDTKPPTMPQPCFNAGELWEPDPIYSDNWLVDMYALRQYGVALLGPEPQSLIPSIKMEDVRQVSNHDLHTKWQQKLDSPEPFGDGKHWSVELIQAYSVLTMCRKLYRAQNDGSDAKPIAAQWAKEKYPEWKNLIEKAENWRVGQPMGPQEKVLDFMKFALKEVS